MEKSPYERKSRLKSNKEPIGIVALSLGIYFIMMPFDSFPVFGMGSLLRVVSLLPITAILLCMLRKNEYIFYLDSLSGILLIYMAAQAITCLYSRHPEVSLDYLQRLILNFALILFVGSMYADYTAKEIDFLKKCLVFGGLATMVFTFVFSDFGSAGRLTISVNGALQDQNMLNGYMLYAYAFFFTGFMKKKKIIYVIPIAGILLFALLTGSRGAILCLVGSAIAIVLTQMIFVKEDRAVVTIIFFLILAVLLLNYNLVLSLLPPAIAQRFSIDYLMRHGSTGRTDIWRYLLRLFRESDIFHTFFGYGYAMVAYINRMNHLVAHNLWIEHLLMGGIIDELIFCSMLILFGYKAWKTRDVTIIGTYAGLLCMMMSLSFLCYKPLWNCMMMIMIMNQYIRRVEYESEYS